MLYKLQWICFVFWRYMQKTAGAIGGAASSLIRVPTEVSFILSAVGTSNVTIIWIKIHWIQVVKQRMQMSQFKTAPDAVRLIVAKEGIKGLYAVCIFQSYDNPLCFIFCECWWIMSTRTINIFIFAMQILISVAHRFHKHVSFGLQGYGSFLLRDLPFDAIQFCIYEQLRIGYRLTVFMSLVFDESNILFMKNSMFFEPACSDWLIVSSEWDSCLSEEARWLCLKWLGLWMEVESVWWENTIAVKE